MNPKQLLSVMAAGLLGAALFGAASAATVRIQVLMPGGGGDIQTYTLTVPDTCERTVWPSMVLSCENIDPNTTPGSFPVVVISPSGRLFNIALGTVNSHIPPRTDPGGRLIDPGHPRDHIEQLGQSIDLGSSVWLATDDAGKAQRAYLVFTKSRSFARFKRGEPTDDLAVSWGTLKSIHN